MTSRRTERNPIPADRRVRAVSQPTWFESLEDRRLLAFDPTASEQYMMELLNRFRLHPAAELGLLTSSLGSQARSSDPDIDNALLFFHTNGTVLAQQWATLSAVAPLAWNQDLYESAEFHNGEMISRNAQEHEFPDGTTLVQRATNAGYTGYLTLGESIYAYGKSVLHGHAGFLLDWGMTPTGIQDPPGHRNSAINPAFREVGIRIQGVATQYPNVGPLVMTLEFGNRVSYGQSALVGVAFADSDANSFYGPGEGLGGVTVQVRNTGNDFGPVIASTVTMSAGGYQLKLAAGVYNVTFVGGAFGSTGVTYRDVAIGAQNAKLDAKQGVIPTDPEIQVYGGPLYDQGIADGDTSPIKADSTYWGDVNVVGAGVERTFVIRNLGNKVLQFTGGRAGISGVNSGEFSITQLPVASLAPGASTTLTVRFTPNTAPGGGGLRNATLLIYSDDLDEPTYNFSIRARTVAAPIMQVKGNGAVIANGDSSPRAGDFTSFGAFNVQGETKTRALRLFNIGSATLNITSITIEGTAAGDFSVLTLPASSIAAGAAITFNVRFDPTLGGVRNATVRVITNDAANSPWTFAITGTGLLLPEIEVRGVDALPIISGAAASVASGTDFGDTRVVNHTRLRSFSLYNLGLAALNLSGPVRVVISGPAASDFKLVTDAPASIGAGASALFSVRFNPSAAGTRSALVTIVSNDSNEAMYTFSLRGVGV